MAAAAFAHHAADEELLRRVIAETGVATDPAGPSLTAYVTACAAAIARGIGRLFSSHPGLTGGLLNAAFIVAVLTLAGALALAAISVFRRLRGRGSQAGAPAPRQVEEIEAGPAPRRNAAAWRVELESRLARGDVAGALEALWWWLAASLTLEAAVDVDPSWTTRELLTRARRTELFGAGATLDVLMYGRLPPSPGDVAACLKRFDEKLA